MAAYGSCSYYYAVSLPYGYYNWVTADYVCKMTDNSVVHALYQNNTGDAIASRINRHSHRL